jgi:hypothetical protein
MPTPSKGTYCWSWSLIAWPRVHGLRFPARQNGGIAFGQQSLEIISFGSQSDVPNRMSSVCNRDKPRSEQTLNKGQTFGASNLVGKWTVHDQKSDLPEKAHASFSIQFMLIQCACVDETISSCATRLEWT